MGRACVEGVFPGWEAEGDVPKQIFSIGGLPPKLLFSQDRVKMAEKACQVKLTSNATWIFPHFDCYVQVICKIRLNLYFVCIFDHSITNDCIGQTPDDPMHQVNLGLWVHLLNAIFFDLKTFLETLKRSSGNSFFGKESQVKVWDR